MYRPYSYMYGIYFIYNYNTSMELFSFLHVEFKSAFSFMVYFQDIVAEEIGIMGFVLTVSKFDLK